MGMPAPRTAVQQGRDVDQRLTLLERAMARLGFVGRDTVAHVGDVKMTARATPPDGWLLCQGQSLLRTAYPVLFDAIGTTYGSADAEHFSLPDLRGRVPVGQDAGQTEFDALGEKGGAKTHTLTAVELAMHSHQFGMDDMVTTAGGYTSVGTFAYDATSSAASNGQHAVTKSMFSGSGTNTPTVGGQPHNNLQPFIVLNYLIKS